MIFARVLVGREREEVGVMTVFLLVIYILFSVAFYVGKT